MTDGAIAYTEEQFQSVVANVRPDYRLASFRRLVGGVSADVFALCVEDEHGKEDTVVFRLHGDRDFSRNPNIASEEFALLDLLHDGGLPVPKPYSVDESCTVFSRPYLIMQFIDGTTHVPLDSLKDGVKQCAEGLARVHRFDVSNHDVSYLPDSRQHFAKFIENQSSELDHSFSEGEIRTALEPVWPLTEENPPAVLHGDFWPGNILWNNGTIVGIIDWEDAMIGDPLADLAITRLELCWAYGLRVMEEFTRHYSSINRLQLTSLPYWDLAAALRARYSLPFWGLDKKKEALMRTSHREFVEYVLVEI